MLNDKPADAAQLSTVLQVPVVAVRQGLEELHRAGLIENVKHLGTAAVYGRPSKQKSAASVIRDERIKAFLMQGIPRTPSEIAEFMQLDSRHANFALVTIRQSEPVWDMLASTRRGAQPGNYYLHPDRTMPPPSQDGRLSGVRWTKAELAAYRRLPDPDPKNPAEFAHVIHASRKTKSKSKKK